MKNTWQVQEAKNKFSEVLERASEEPQVITKNGRNAGVLLSYSDYRKRIQGSKRTIRGLYSKAPKFEADELDFQRDRDTGRDVRL